MIVIIGYLKLCKCLKKRDWIRHQITQHAVKPANVEIAFREMVYIVKKTKQRSDVTQLISNDFMNDDDDDGCN